MSDRLSRQLERNRESRDSWEAFADHRTRVTSLLLESTPSTAAPSLCLFGAGNCNDVDLPHLLSRFERIHLVDYDAAALSAGVQRQELHGEHKLALHGGVDLRAEPPWQPELVEVAASLCLLSQLLEDDASRAHASGPSALQQLQATRRRHLQLLVESLKPGGQGILITDLVSSETVPQLSEVSHEQLPRLIADCIARRNFFTGLNPAAILDVLRNDPWFAARLESVTPIDPWKWDFGPRCYAVYGVRFQLRSQT